MFSQPQPLLNEEREELADDDLATLAWDMYAWMLHAYARVRCSTYVCMLICISQYLLGARVRESRYFVRGNQTAASSRARVYTGRPCRQSVLVF